jgi:sulfur relay (sulfurtransferase) DsrF/TusC family protein
MAGAGGNSLALIISSQPYSNRSARSDMDVALAAAALDFRLEVFFLGSAVLQLAEEKEPQGALLPPGYRAWASLPELAEIHVCAEKFWIDYCDHNGIVLLMPVEALSESQMRRAWRQCRHAWVL